MLVALAGPLAAQEARIALFSAPLSRDGPGLLLRDILDGDDPQIAAVLAILAEVRPDILVLTDFDWDLDGAALAAFAAAAVDEGLDWPYRHAPMPNAGLASGLDLDGNRRLGEARDAQGYGRFTGDGGMALLSRWPIDLTAARDFSDLLWRDLPGAVLPFTAEGAPFPFEAAQAAQRLSSVGHWMVPVLLPQSPPLTLLVWSATPPVFDGREDLNGLRNRDEMRFWQEVLDGSFGPPPEDFVLIGNANLDPVDGDGLRESMAAFLADPMVQDSRPYSPGGRAAADPGQNGDPALDTAEWDDPPGNLRVGYVLPSSSLTITDAGVFWPAPDDPQAALLGSDGRRAGPHRLIWLDIVG